MGPRSISLLLQPCTSKLSTGWSPGIHPNSNEIHHRNSSCNLNLLQIPLHMFRQTFACHCPRVRPASTCTYGQGQVFQKKFRKRVLDLAVPVWEGMEEGMAGNTRTGHSFQFCWGATPRSFHRLPHEDKTLVFRVPHAFPNLITYSRGDL